jgi:hypothetical protein
MSVLYVICTVKRYRCNDAYIICYMYSRNVTDVMMSVLYVICTVKRYRCNDVYIICYMYSKTPI